MRILALGNPLPDSQIDNFDWGSAPSFFDYDAIIVDPALAVSELIEGILRKGNTSLTYSDEPIEDGPTTATSIGLADLLRRRQDEVARLLARGGLVVCFAYPDVNHPRVTGFAGAHRLYFLPAPDGKDYGTSFIKPAHGNSLTVTDYEHTFADFLEAQSHNVLYRAIFAEGVDGAGSQATVIARSPGGAPVALNLMAGGGRIVFLPALPSRLSAGERSGVASRLVRAIRNTLLLTVEEQPPGWMVEYRLPGLEEARRKVEETESGLEALEVELDDLRNEYRGIDRYRRILWQEGKYGFELPVRDCLALLGFTSIAGIDDPATFLYDGETVLVETASGPSAIGMEPHYRLRQRIEQRIATTGNRPRGVIVINGYRDRDPGGRDQQFEGSLKVASESMRYCVVQADALFEAVQAHFEGDGDDASFCKALVETEGIFVPPQRQEWTPVAATADASPSEASESKTDGVDVED